MKTYRKTLTIVLLALLVSALIPIPAFAADINVTTDKASYLADELVTISGVADASVLVGIQVKNPDESTIYTDSVLANSLGAYESILSAPSTLGIYTVYVSITGATDSCTFTVTDVPVENIDPVADANGPYSGEEGVAISFDGSGSSDEDGTIESYAWDFGDEVDGIGISPSHAYAAAGIYTVNLIVTDDDGATHTDTTTATVTEPGAPPANVDPVADADGPYSGFVGTSISFDGSGSSDSDGTIESYAWIFGDGGTGTGVSPSHTYDDADIYPVTLTVTDDDEATDSDTATVTVSEVVAKTGFSIDYVSSDVVQYGDVLTVMGSDVTSGNVVYIYWDFVTASGLLNTTTGLPSGDFECTVKVPSAYYGDDHYLWARDISTGLTTSYGPIRVMPKITLSPTSGLKSDSVIVKGYGFSKKSDIDITFTGLLATAGVDKTDDLGYFEYTFKVGAVGDDTYTVTAKDANTHITSADFTVGVALTIDKTVGPAGTIVKIDGRGFTPNTKIITKVDITLGGTVPVSTKDGKNVTTSSTGTFTAYLVIPSVPKGDYKITIDGGPGKVATAKFEVDGETCIKLMPNYGVPGAVMTVKGYNYSQVPVKVTIELGAQTWTATTNSKGEWTRTITIPPLDVGLEYPVVAYDERNCDATEDVLVALIILQLSETSGPVGSKVNLMGVGFDATDGGDWNATFEDIGIIGNSEITSGTTFSKEFWIPSVAPGTYTITVTDWNREIHVTTEFTVTDPATLTPKRTQVPNRYNLSIYGENFAEKDEVETTWYLYNSTDVWDISDDVIYGGAAVETTEYGNFTGYFKIPWNIELGEYTINCTTETEVEEVKVEQYAEFTIEVIPEEMDIRIGKTSYARGDIITFTIKASLQKEEFYLGIKDPDSNEVFNSTWDDSHWKTIGAWYYIPQNLQIDDFTDDQYTIPSDATSGTWSYALWDLNSTIMGSGTFQVTEKTELEMLQDNIAGVTGGLTNLSTIVTDLATTVGLVNDAVASSSDAADNAKAAADEAKAAADAATVAIGEVSDKSDNAKAAADDAKEAAEAAKTAADNGLAAANDAKVTSESAKLAAEKAAEAAKGAKTASDGLTTLVYGAIAASLIAALAAIVSLMQINKRIAG